VAAYPGGPLGGAIRPLLQSLAGDAGLHYPGAYAALPRALATIGPWLGLALTWPGLTLLLVVMPRVLRDGGERRGVPSFGLFARAILAAAPFALLSGAVPVLQDRVGAIAVGVAGLAATWAVGALGLLMTSAVAHAPPGAVLGRMGPGAALGASFSMAAQFPWLTAGVLLLEGAGLALLRLSPPVVGALFDRIPPETVLVWLAFGALLSGLLAAFRVATFGRLFLHVHGEAPR
jgi:hypothetical protein